MILCLFVFFSWFVILCLGGDVDVAGGPRLVARNYVLGGCNANPVATGAGWA